MANEPVFFMSEGERLFSEAHAVKYSLLVVSGIDLRGDSHSNVRVQDGPVTSENAALETVQWRGGLRGG